MLNSKLIFIMIVVCSIFTLSRSASISDLMKSNEKNVDKILQPKSLNTQLGNKNQKLFLIFIYSQTFNYQHLN